MQFILLKLNQKNKQKERSLAKIARLQSIRNYYKQKRAVTQCYNFLKISF